MQFGNQHFILLLCVPLVFLLAWLRARKRRQQLSAFADPKLLERVYPAFSSERRRNLMHGAAIGAITFALVLTLLRPQFGYSWEEATSSGIDIVIALDVSNSMLAQDVPPNRLQRARREIIDLIQRLQGDRIGLVAFAGTAFIQVPLTLDYETAVASLSNLDTDLIPIQGTNLFMALTKSLEALGITKQNSSSESTSPADGKSRAVILITDGEDLEGDFETVKALANRYQVRIYIFGIGTPEGGPIPVRGGFKRDDKGGMVLSKLLDSELAQLATATGGIYVTAISSDEDTGAIYESGLKKVLQERELKGRRTKRWHEYFQFPLFLALLLLLSGPILRLGGMIRGGMAAVVALTGLLFANLQPVAAQNLPLIPKSAEALGYSGRKAFEHGDFSDALRNFEGASEKQGEDARYLLGQGASYYRLGDYEHAASTFMEAVEKSKDPIAKGEARYNAANSLVQLGKLEEAIKGYEEVLRANPQDEDAQNNLAYAKRLLEEQKQQKKQGKNQQQPDQNQQSENEQQSQSQSSEQESNQQQNEQQSQEQQSQEQQSTDQQNREQENQSQSSEQDSKQSGEQSEQEQSPDNKQQQQRDSSEEEHDQKQSNDQSSKDEQSSDTQSESKGSGGNEQRESPEQGDQNQPSPPSSQPLHDQLESILDDVEEGENPVQQYRAKKAMSELKKNKQRPPKVDW